jgi:hypothetical protein
VSRGPDGYSGSGGVRRKTDSDVRSVRGLLRALYLQPRGPKAFLRVQPVYNHLPLDRAEAAMALQKSGLPPPGWSRYGSHRTGLNKWGACTFISLPPSPERILTISQIMLTRELWGIAATVPVVWTASGEE